jgi:hypothetical protein
VTNVTKPSINASTTSLQINATVPKPTVSPTISGYKGVAAGLQTPASSFALGALVFMAALMV